MNTLLHFAQSYYGYDYTTTTSSTSNLDPAMVAGIIVFSLIFALVAYVVTALLLGRIFKKAGVASWIAWVPFYNQWKLLEIGGQPGFWAVLMIVPLVQYVSLVFMFIAMYNIGLKLGKSGAFVLLAIFLQLVWLIWLAVDGSTWNDSLGAPSRAVEHTGAGTPPTVPPTTPPTSANVL